MPKISELPLATELKDNDWIPIVQDGETRKVAGTHFVTQKEFEEDLFTPTIRADNKLSYSFGEGDSTNYTASSQDGMFKSAVLVGNTLVNMFDKRTTDVSVQEITSDTKINLDYSEQYSSVLFGQNQSNSATTVTFKLSQNLQEDKVYYVNTFVFDGYITHDAFLIRDRVNGINLITTEVPGYPRGQLLSFTPTKNTNELVFYYMAHSRKTGSPNFGKEFLMPKRFIVGENLNDVANFDLSSYFTGMQSVKMPVLSTTGKNLANKDSIVKGYINAGSKEFVKNDSMMTVFFKCEKDTDYICSCDKTLPRTVWGKFDKIPTQTSGEFAIATLTSVKINSGNANYLGLFFSNVIDDYDLQIEKGTVATPYEPYKSNILSCLEEVELGKVGDVADTLDVLKSVDNCVINISDLKTLNGTEAWGYDAVNANGLKRFICYTNNKTTSVLNNILCDKLPTINTYNATTEGVSMTSDGVIYILKPSITTIADFKTWISQNNINYIHQLAAPVVKTVDLSGLPIGFKNGHIMKSAEEGSLQNYGLTYELPINRSSQITENSKAIKHNSDELSKLEEKLNKAIEIIKQDAITLLKLGEEMNNE